MEKVKDWNYKVLKKIRAGGFGEVYKCLNLVTSQKVAIKLITVQNELEGVPGFVISRVSLLKELKHENIVRLLDVLSSGRYLYLVFEYLDLDLGSFIRKQKITSNSPVLKAILRQILAGLAYYHSLKVLHRDLKPRNLLIDLKGNKVKLADFGLATSFGAPHKEYSYSELESPYTAPEMRIRSSEYSAPLDMWAVGCIFAQMVTGKPLFPRGKKDHLSLVVSLLGKPTKETWPGVTYISELLHSYPHCEPVNLAEKFQSLEPAGVNLLSQMLHLNPGHRITANDALQHEYLEGSENLPFILPSSSPIALVNKILKGDFKVSSRFSPFGGAVYSSQMHDKYEYILEIGKGSGGVIHKCRHYETNQIVAIKNIRITDPSEGVPSSVIREIALLKELEHDNIVRLLDVQSDVKSVNLVLEYLDMNLHKFIRQYPMDLHLIKKFLYCILCGIAYCHAHKIIHRDMKPKNLLVDLEKKIVKIADFGMAKEVYVPLNTHTAQAVTLWYKAPEILLGSTNYSAAVDMWAVGCIFAEMVKGKRQFGGLFESDILNGIFSYFGMPDADTLPEVTSLSESRRFLHTPVNMLNLADKLTRLEPDGLDLLSRMLCLNPTARITAESALNHAYFKDFHNNPQLRPCYSYILYE